MPTIKLQDIIIPEKFLKTFPHQEKIEEKRAQFNKYSPIVISKKNILLDGYIQYLLLKENNEEFCTVSYKNHDPIYIYGKHYENGPEYIWTITDKKKNKIGRINVGDHLWVNTQYGVRPIIVTRFECLKTPPIKGEIKTVCGKIKNWKQKEED